MSKTERFWKTLLRAKKKLKQTDLIASIQSGDKRAFKALFDQYAELFKGIAYRYVGNLDEANDIVQEAFIKIFKNINSYTGKGNFEGWMKRILINCSLDYIKKIKRVVFESDEVLAKEASLTWDQAITTMSFNEILKLIDRLPKGYKTVFNLYVFEGYSHKEIGEMIGITESASRSQLTKAKVKLKEELKKVNIISSSA